ncbi:MAG: TetR/AcrR family transcriptional regulator [Bacteriovoracaceae bacterium]
MPKIVNHSVMRSELLMRSFEFFYHFGFQGTSMRDLSKKLKVSTGTLYHYFVDKEDLFEKMMMELSTQDIDYGKSLLNSSGTSQNRWQKFSEFIEEKEDYFKMLLILLIDFQRNKNKSKNSNFHQILENYVLNIKTELNLSTDVKAEIFFNALIGFLVRQLIIPSKSSKNDLHEYIKALKSSLGE